MDSPVERFAATYRHPESGDELVVRLEEFPTGDARDPFGWRVLAEYIRGGGVGGAAVPIHESGRLATALRALNGELEVYGEEGFRDVMGNSPVAVTTDEIDIQPAEIGAGGIDLD